jgi:hypothetical protein
LTGGRARGRRSKPLSAAFSRRETMMGERAVVIVCAACVWALECVWG